MILQTLGNYKASGQGSDDTSKIVTQGREAGGERPWVIVCVWDAAMNTDTTDTVAVRTGRRKPAGGGVTEARAISLREN